MNSPLLRSLAVFALSFFVGGCGVDESTHDPARPGSPPPPPISDGRASNLADTSLQKVDLEVSFGYDSLLDRGLAYFSFRDQDGRSLWDFRNPQGTDGFHVNGHNFAITLFPYVAPRNLIPSTFRVDVSDEKTGRVIALVMDVSGSMGWKLDADQPVGPGETSRMDVAKEAAKLFVDAILADDQTDDLIALVSFSSDARILTSLTNDRDLLKARIDGLTPLGATNFGAAFSEAVKAVGIYPGKRAVVFLTDGEDTVDLGTDTLPLFSWPDWGTAAKRNHSLRWEALHNLLDYELVSYTIGFGPVAFDADAAADLRAFAGDPTLAVPPPEGYPVGRYYSAPTAEDLLDAFDPQSPDSIPARIGVLPGIRSPYVSFVNDYHDPAGPIDAIVTLWFENANGNLYSSARGTYIVP